MPHPLGPDAAAQPQPGSSPLPTRRPDRGEADGERELAAYLHDLVERGSSPALHALRSPVRTARAAAALRRLPVLDASFGGTVEGGAIRREYTRFRSRRMLLGLTSVLEVPEDPATYRAGASKQTLRRKTRAAQANGVTWRRVDDEDERHRLLALANLYERLNEREAYRQERPENDDLLDVRLWLAAFAADGSPLLLSVTPCADEWAILRYFRTLSADPAGSDARYWMTDVLVEHLSRMGVRHLIDAAVPHWLPNGLRHFQRMVGFRLVRIRVRG